MGALFLKSEVPLYMQVERLAARGEILRAFKVLQVASLPSKSFSWQKSSVGHSESPVNRRLSVLSDQFRCRANMAHIRQSRPGSGLGFQVKVLKPI